MMLVEKLALLLNIKKEIRQAIIKKGVEVSENIPFVGYAEKISLIKTGGAGNDFRYSDLVKIVYIPPFPRADVREEINLTTSSNEQFKYVESVDVEYHMPFVQTIVDKNLNLNEINIFTLAEEIKH